MLFLFGKACQNPTRLRKNTAFFMEIYKLKENQMFPQKA